MIQLPPHFSLDQGFEVTHDLAEHPLLSSDAILALADRLPPGSAEPSLFGLVARDGLDYRPPPMVDAGPALAELDGREESLYLYNIERDPEVGPLALGTLRDTYPQLGVDPRAVTKEEAYVFLSGGPSTTSAHVDHELNFLLVLRGRKHVFIADVPSREGELALEALHSGRYGSCASVPASGREFDIGPGQGVFIPPQAAHYVINGDEPCAALSIVFATTALERQSEVYAANAVIRRLGMNPSPPGARPFVDRAKSGGIGVARALKRTLAIGRR